MVPRPHGTSVDNSRYLEEGQASWLILARPNYDIQPGLSNCVNHRGQRRGRNNAAQSTREILAGQIYLSGRIDVAFISGKSFSAID